MNRTLEDIAKIKVAKNQDFIYDSKKLSPDIFQEILKKIKNKKPLYHSNDIKCLPYEDKVSTNSLSQNEALKNSKKTKDNYFVTIKPH